MLPYLPYPRANKLTIRYFNSPHISLELSVHLPYLARPRVTFLSPHSPYHSWQLLFAKYRPVAAGMSHISMFPDKWVIRSHVCHDCLHLPYPPLLYLTQPKVQHLIGRLWAVSRTQNSQGKVVLPNDGTIHHPSSLSSSTASLRGVATSFPNLPTCELRRVSHRTSMRATAFACA